MIRSNVESMIFTVVLSYLMYGGDAYFVFEDFSFFLFMYVLQYAD